MPGRVVIEWDKDDCADLGLVKVDLLGLGMMAVLEDSLDLIREHYHEEVDLAHLPQDDPAVYQALQKADTIGMFQVESRAQMSCLPRMKPEKFYDIVVQVAIIRPGPIVGKMMHPYLRPAAGIRGAGLPASDRLKPVLKRTLGVPLFQEQLLRIAMIAANFTGGEAEELRRAMGFKRSEARMRDIETRLRERHEQERHRGRDAGSHRAVHHFVRAVRISRVACRQLRPDRLCQRVSQVPLSGGLHRGDSEQSADGLLSSRDAGEGRATPWTAFSAGGCHAVGLAMHDRTAGRSARGTSGIQLREGFA